MKTHRKKTTYQVSKKQRSVLGFFLFALLFFFSGALHTHAQLQIPITIQSSSSAPQPGQTVTLTAKTFSLKLDSAYLTWTVNDQEYASGIGVDSIQITLGDSGDQTRVSVSAIGIDGVTASTQRTFTPAEVTLIWEAQTYTPPLYEGKALFSKSAFVRFIALPNIVENGRRYSSDELIFTWKDNGKVIGGQSGLGRNTFFLQGSRFGRDMQVSVEVETPTGTSLARAILRIPTTEPNILLYERTPLAGIDFAHARTNQFQLEEQEVAFEAYPYFFSAVDRNSAHLEYTWRVAGERVSDTGRISTITLRRGEGVGTVPVTLSIQNVREILQKAAAALSVTIGVTNE